MSVCESTCAERWGDNPLSSIPFNDPGSKILQNECRIQGSSLEKLVGNNLRGCKTISSPCVGQVAEMDYQEGLVPI